MANIISLICFSNANNDTANNGSDFKVSACECTAWIFVFLLFSQSSGDWRAACFGEPARYRVRAPYVFPEDDAVKMCAEWGWALKFNTNLSLFCFCLAVNWSLKLHANLLSGFSYLLLDCARPLIASTFTFKNLLKRLLVKAGEHSDMFVKVFLQNWNLGSF